MHLSIATTLAWQLPGPADMLLQVEVASDDEQRVIQSRLDCDRPADLTRIPALDGIGERIWVHREGGPFRVEYMAEVEVQRIVPDPAMLLALPLHRLPGAAVPYLMDSSYCPASRFSPFVTEEFQGLTGGVLITAMRDWIARHYRYVPGTSTASTTAIDSFVERRGVCRDFAHTMLCFARAAAIPARFASGYAPGVKPQDFHAVAEVWLIDGDGNGGWHVVDATGMADAASFARIAVGRDAGDASFLTSYGPAELIEMTIRVD